MTPSPNKLLHLHTDDNIMVVCARIEDGESISVKDHSVVIPKVLELGHKIAMRDIAKGETIFKYGMPIGEASKGIALGEHVHVHNIQSRYTTIEIME